MVLFLVLLLFQSIKLALLFILLDMYQRCELKSSCFSPTREQLCERSRAQKEGKNKATSPINSYTLDKIGVFFHLLAPPSGTKLNWDQVLLNFTKTEQRLTLR